MVPPGIHEIRHVIIVMQENRSFDSYFGTFPGADGIPMRGGVPTVCSPDPRTGTCVKPFHNVADVNGGGPHGYPNAEADIDGGRMDGFVGQRVRGRWPRDAVSQRAPGQRRLRPPRWGHERHPDQCHRGRSRQG